MSICIWILAIIAMDSLVLCYAIVIEEYPLYSYPASIASNTVFFDSP